jgi:uncharacterized protein GlcG (DUF336 family)
MASISLSRARQIIRKTLATGREMGLKPLSVIVLDDGGHPIAFEREDDASPGRYKIAEGKAYGAIMLGIGGEAQFKRAENQAYFLLAANGAFDGKVIPVAGGILVRSKTGKVLGAVGVTGDTSGNDAAAGRAGIEAANLVAET